jgi:hypothetical protein
MIMKGHFRNLSWIKTAPTPIVLSIDTPTQMEPSFISEKMVGQEYHHVLPAETSYKNVFFSCNHFLQLHEIWLQFR